MPQSLAAVYIHLVFSTKGRYSFLVDEEIRNGLHAYMGGISRHSGCQPLGIGGTSDHVHLLVQLGRTTTIADLVRDVKGKSSMWTKPQVPDFEWQKGYGAFSFAQADLPALQAYVNGQEEHHRRESFQEEFLRLLHEHSLAYDERYLWE
jgi:putative transposase